MYWLTGVPTGLIAIVVTFKHTIILQNEQCCSFWSIKKEKKEKGKVLFLVLVSLMAKLNHRITPFMRALFA